MLKSRGCVNQMLVDAKLNYSSEHTQDSTRKNYKLVGELVHNLLDVEFMPAEDENLQGYILLAHLTGLKLYISLEKERLIARYHSEREVKKEIFTGLNDDIFLKMHGWHQIEFLPMMLFFTCLAYMKNASKLEEVREIDRSGLVTVYEDLIWKLVNSIRVLYKLMQTFGHDAQKSSEEKKELIQVLVREVRLLAGVKMSEELQNTDLKPLDETFEILIPGGITDNHAIYLSVIVTEFHCSLFIYNVGANSEDHYTVTGDKNHIRKYPYYVGQVDLEDESSVEKFILYLLSFSNGSFVSTTIPRKISIIQDKLYNIDSRFLDKGVVVDTTVTRSYPQHRNSTCVTSSFFAWFYSIYGHLSAHTGKMKTQSDSIFSLTVDKLLKFSVTHTVRSITQDEEEDTNTLYPAHADEVNTNPLNAYEDLLSYKCKNNSSIKNLIIATTNKNTLIDLIKNCYTKNFKKIRRILYVESDDLSRTYLTLSQNTDNPISTADLASGPLMQGERHILIEGNAGTGKSTLCQKVALDWASSIDNISSISEKALLVWLPFKTLNKFEEAITLEEWIYKTLHISDEIPFDEFNNLFASVQQEYPNQVRYVLDGYDEALRIKELYPCHSELIYNVLDQSDWVMTSRKGCVDKAKLKTDSVELLGFSDDDISRFIFTFFNERCRLSAQKKSASPYIKSVINQINTNVKLQELVHCPFQLEMICSVWWNAFEDKSQLSELTITQVYDHMLVHQSLATRHSKKKVSQVDLSVLKDDDIKKFILFLEKIAWLGKQHRSFTIKPMEFYDCFPKSKYTKTQFLEKLYRDFGLIRPFGEIREDLLEQPFEFVHEIMQDYFAARYLSKCIRENKLPMRSSSATYESLDECFAEIKYHARFNLLLQFTVGCLRNNQNHIKRFFDLVNAEPREKIGINHISLLIKIVDDSLIDLSDPIFSNLLNAIRTVLAMSGSDSTSLGYRVSSLIRSGVSSSHKAYSEIYIKERRKALLLNYVDPESENREENERDLDFLIPLVKNNNSDSIELYYKICCKLFLNIDWRDEKFLKHKVEVLILYAKNYAIKFIKKAIKIENVFVRCPIFSLMEEHAGIVHLLEFEMFEILVNCIMDAGEVTKRYAERAFISILNHNEDLGVRWLESIIKDEDQVNNKLVIVLLGIKHMKFSKDIPKTIVNFIMNNLQPKKNKLGVNVLEAIKNLVKNGWGGDEEVERYLDINSYKGKRKIIVFSIRISLAREDSSVLWSILNEVKIEENDDDDFVNRLIEEVDGLCLDNPRKAYNYVIKYIHHGSEGFSCAACDSIQNTFAERFPDEVIHQFVDMIAHGNRIIREPAIGFVEEFVKDNPSTALNWLKTLLTFDLESDFDFESDLDKRYIEDTIMVVAWGAMPVDDGTAWKYIMSSIVSDENEEEFEEGVSSLFRNIVERPQTYHPEVWGLVEKYILNLKNYYLESKSKTRETIGYIFLILDLYRINDPNLADKIYREILNGNNAEMFVNFLSLITADIQDELFIKYILAQIEKIIDTENDNKILSIIMEKLQFFLRGNTDSIIELIKNIQDKKFISIPVSLFEKLINIDAEKAWGLFEAQYSKQFSYLDILKFWDSKTDDIAYCLNILPLFLESSSTAVWEYLEQLLVNFNQLNDIRVIGTNYTSGQLAKGLICYYLETRLFFPVCDWLVKQIDNSGSDAYVNYVDIITFISMTKLCNTLKDLDSDTNERKIILNLFAYKIVFELSTILLFDDHIKLISENTMFEIKLSTKESDYINKLINHICQVLGITHACYLHEKNGLYSSDEKLSLIN